MKLSKLNAIVISLLCITLFTACGERDSKKRKSTAVYSGPVGNTDSELGASDVHEDEVNNSENGEDNESKNNPDKTEETGDTNDTGTSDNNDTEATTVETTPTETEDILVIDNDQLPGNTQNNTTQTTENPDHPQDYYRVDPISGLAFYPSSSFNAQNTVPQSTHTGYTNEQDYPFTDLKSDHVMSQLNQLFANDISESKNKYFKDESLELAQSINHVYSSFASKNSLNVTFYIGQKDTTESILHFKGYVDGRKGTLLTTNISADHDYILDVTCLDSTGDQCQNQQLVLSYYYKEDHNKGHYKKGDLCKRSYIVNRTSHATFNVSSQLIDQQIIKTQPERHYLQQKCYNNSQVLMNSGPLCLADFVYNTLNASRFNACKRKVEETGDQYCLSKLNPPKSNYKESRIDDYAQLINLHTYAVANGKAELLLSIIDREDNATSFNGLLLDTVQKKVATKLRMDSYNVSSYRTSPSRIQKYFKSAHLNGIDKNGTLQLKIAYNQSTNEQKVEYVDIIPRLPRADVQHVTTEFSLPTQEEMDELRREREEQQEDSDTTGNQTDHDSDPLVVNSLIYSCSELKQLVQTKKHLFIGSVEVFSDDKSCPRKDGLDYNLQPEIANFKTKDKKSFFEICSQVGFQCTRAAKHD